ncbi:hypothetical protein MBLNU459_g2649t2 [Dothideomycetes sp. NU459]
MSTNEIPDGRSTPSSALSPASTLVEDTSRSPIRHRPTFARLTSVLDDGQQKYNALKGEEDITETPAHRETTSVSGLGIEFSDSPYTKHSSGASLADTLGISYDPGAGHDPTTSDWPSPGRTKRAPSSFRSSIQQGFTPQSETQPLRHRQSFVDTLRMTYEVGPRYGRIIGSNGAISSANANLLAALIAKTIELSFATVFVAFLGQALWRRASVRSQGRGVTLAEMDMRSWVMQPGTMLTRFVAIRSSVLSLLGILSLTAAVMAMLYTTASEALVQPQLRFDGTRKGSVQGLVKASWANAQYLGQQCQSPTKAVDDVTDGAGTCIEVEYAAQSYHNFQRYIGNWYNVANNGNGSTELVDRPQGWAMLTDNTTVTARWIEIQNYAAEVGGRIVNNVSMAMPHAGVPAAARDGINGILQPEDLDGLGVYSLHASVPSPVVNVLCVNMNASELTPIVYNEWTNGSFDAPTWFSDQIGTVGPEFINNKTVVDDLFGWGPKYGHSPPVFGKLPLNYNTILNNTGPYGREAIYLLGKGDPASDYVVCSIKALMTPHCSTRYNVSSAWATLEAICEDSEDQMQYIHSVTNATTGNATVNLDWVATAQDWSSSLSLDAGLTDGNASIARLLMQLILEDEGTGPALSGQLPSPAEALSVMAGCTLLMGTQDSPFVPDWNYSTPNSHNILDPGQYQNFNATLRAQEYASGGSKGYQHGFYIVLISVFVLNVICLVYLLINKGMVTDYSEPVNLFSLAVNSPPSDAMAGSCGGGPQAKQYSVPWYIQSAGDHLYIENGDRHEEEAFGESLGRGTYLQQLSPMGKVFKRFSKRADQL